MKVHYLLSIILLLSYSALEAYLFTFSNNYKNPVRFFIEYGSFLCDNDDITINPGAAEKTIHTGACCWHTIGVEIQGKKDTFRVIDVYQSTAGALTMPSCRDQHFWVNADGYFIVTQGGQDHIVQKLSGAF